MPLFILPDLLREPETIDHRQLQLQDRDPCESIRESIHARAGELLIICDRLLQLVVTLPLDDGVNVRRDMRESSSRQHDPADHPHEDLRVRLFAIERRRLTEDENAEGPDE